MPPRGQNSFIFMQFSANIFKTSMHSRRMCTGCAFAVCRVGGEECLTMVPGGVCLWSWRVCFWSGRGGTVGGSCLWSEGGSAYGSGGSALGPGGGVSAYGPMGSAFGPGGYPSMQWGRPPPVWTESQTRVKTKPWPQLRCGR